MGRQIMTISGFAYDTAKGKTPDIGSTRAIPVISRLYKDETKDYQMQTRFFDLRKHTGGYFKRHKYLLDQGDTQGAREFFNKNRNALKVYSLVDAHTKRIGKFKRDINKRKKSGILGSKIQPLEDRMQSERIRGMSSILKQARQLGIYL
jgi:tRNA-dihydrouridine synthase